MEYYQSMARSQEARDRSIMNANHDRVLFWSIFNSIVLIGVGAVQVKKMFEYLFEFLKCSKDRQHRWIIKKRKRVTYLCI